MARIRTIKPEFWTSEQITKCSVSARLLFIGMWNFCDDWGRCPDSPGRLKMQILPADDMSIHDLLTELSVTGLIHRYSVDGKDFIQITGWQHQVINRRAKKSLYPSSPAFTEHSLKTHGVLMQCKTKKEPPLPPKKEAPLIPLKKEHPSTPPKEDSLISQKEVDEFFESWWKHVPRKVGIGQARKAFRAAFKKTDLQTLIAGIKKYAKSVVDNPEFIVHPSTWLNGERWLDEPPPRKKAAWEYI